jgi:hypothetical protein
MRCDYPAPASPSDRCHRATNWRAKSYLSTLFSALTQKLAVSQVIPTLTKKAASKSNHFHTYAKTGGGGMIRRRYCSSVLSRNGTPTSGTILRAGIFQTENFGSPSTICSSNFGVSPLSHKLARCRVRYASGPPSARSLRSSGRGMQTNSVSSESLVARTIA